MAIKKLELFQNICLITDKVMIKDTLHLGNLEVFLSFLHQHCLLLEEAKQENYKNPSRSKIVISISDPYLAELGTLIKDELFFIEQEIDAKIVVIESKEFFMAKVDEVGLVIFVGEVEKKYAQYCLANNILLLSVVSSGYFNKSNVYRMPFNVNDLATLIWFFLFTKNI